MKRYIQVADGWITLRQYIDGVKYAKTHPDAVFKQGLTCWWSCTGAAIMQQFRAGMHDRITQAIPYDKRGLK